MTTVEVLKAARAIIDTPSKWHGKDHPRCSRPGTNCADLALDKAATGEGRGRRSEARRFLCSAIGLPAYLFSDVWKWNDSATHPEVMAKYDEAIALAAAAESAK